MAQEYVLSEQDEYLGHPQRYICGIKVSIFSHACVPIASVSPDSRTIRVRSN